MNTGGIIQIIKNAIANNNSNLELSFNNFYNPKETIDRIECILAKKFISNVNYKDGSEKRFYDIVSEDCDTASVNIELDCSDVQIYTNDIKDRYRAVVFNEAIREWNEKKHMGVLFNRTADYLPRYGSVVAKWRDDLKTMELIPIDRILIAPSVSNIYNTYKIQSPYLIEKHYLTTEELQNMAGRGWNKKYINEIVERLRELFTKNIRRTSVCVYELHCEVPDSWVKGNKETEDISGEWNKYRIYAVYDEELGGEYILYSNKEKDFPYKKIDYSVVFGRCWGKGIVEDLFDNQERINELTNQIADSGRIGSKRVWATSDRKLDGSTINDLEQDSIIYSDRPITRLDTSTPDQGIYQFELNNWVNNGRRISNSTEAITGEQLKTNTTYRSHIKQIEMGSKKFLKIKEELGLFFKEIYIDWVIPEIKRELKGNLDKELINIFSEKSLALMVEMEIKKILDDKISEEFLLNGVILSEEEKEQARILALKKYSPKQIKMQITKDLLNVDYGVEINITGESRVDLLDSKISALNILSQQVASGNGNEILQKNVEEITNSLMEDFGVSKDYIIK